MIRRLVGRLAWPLTERLCGRDTMARRRELLRTDFASSDELTAIQTAKLRRLLRVAMTGCAYYAERLGAAGLDATDPHLGPGDLPALPTITRADITEHLAEMTCRNGPAGPPIPYTTGGSSGEPLKFYIDRARQSADWAARWRARDWWGIRPGDPEVILWGAPSRDCWTERLRRRRDALLNQCLLSAFNMSEATMGAYIRRLRTLRPACVYGYASSLGLLARQAIDMGTSLSSLRLKGVFVTGEMLLDTDRKAIETAFAAPVVIEYGCRDGGLLALGCPAGELHVPQENVIVEVLDDDGRPVSPGEIGEVTVTYLEMFAMPLIRYRTGDLARLPADAGRECPCTCGRSSMRLAGIRGRLTDQIVTRDRNGLRRMHALSLIYVLREMDGLRQFRIVQPSLERLEVEIVADDRLTPAAEAAIETGLRQRMGHGVTVHIQRRERIQPIASGKHACVISLVK